MYVFFSHPILPTSQKILETKIAHRDSDRILLIMLDVDLYILLTRFQYEYHIIVCLTAVPMNTSLIYIPEYH